MSEIDQHISSGSDDWLSAEDKIELMGAGESDDESDDFDDEEEIEIGEEDAPVGAQHRIIQYVPDDERQTSDFLTLYERTQLEIITANRIADTGVVMTDCSGLDEAILMARREIAMRKSPYVLLRCVGEWVDPDTGITHRRVERWRVNDIS